MSFSFKIGSNQTSPVKVPSALEAWMESAPDLPFCAYVDFNCCSEPRVADIVGTVAGRFD